MNKALIRTALVAAGIGASGGYWLAWQQAGGPEPAETRSEKHSLVPRIPLNPEGAPTMPAADGTGTDSIPAHGDESDSTHSGSQATPPAGGQERKILYYRHPMGLPDTSPVPKKDSMGMDYIPVYADEESPEGAGVLQVSTEKIQRLGVRTALVENTRIAQTVRSLGLVEADERRLYTVTLRFDGFIEKLYVDTTGQTVARGQPLFELYSPDLVSAQTEYLAARSARAALAHNEPSRPPGRKDLTDSSLERLRNWGISESELTGLVNDGEVRRTLVIRSPASGIVLEKSVVAGARATAGDILFRIADLSTVWIIADVYEQDIGLIELGQPVQARLDAYPGRIFPGRVGFIYPTLNPTTRTARVRIELPNPNGLLKPMMYARLEIGTQGHRALSVPRSAVLESGRRALVLVDRGAGRFEPRPVRPGTRGDDRIEILEGLRERERVVVRANFLIDAESNLKSALGTFEPAGSGTKSTAPSEPSRRPADRGDQ